MYTGKQFPREQRRQYEPGNSPWKLDLDIDDDFNAQNLKLKFFNFFLIKLTFLRKRLVKCCASLYANSILAQMDQLYTLKFIH